MLNNEVLNLPDLENVVRDVPGLKGLYRVSSNGDVYSYDRYVLGRNGSSRLIRGRKMKTRQNSKEESLTVSISVDGVKTKAAVQTLLYATFPEGYPKIKDLPDEEWKTHPRYTDYQISNMGRVKALSKHRGTKLYAYVTPERLIDTTIDPNYGYCRVTLYSAKRKDGTCFHLSTLVYLLFGDETIGQNHYFKYLNGDLNDCRIANLSKCKSN